MAFLPSGKFSFFSFELLGHGRLVLASSFSVQGFPVAFLQDFTHGFFVGIRQLRVGCQDFRAFWKFLFVSPALRLPQSRTPERLGTMNKAFLYIHADSKKWPFAMCRHFLQQFFVLDD